MCLFFEFHHVARLPCPVNASRVSLAILPIKQDTDYIVVQVVDAMPDPTRRPDDR